MRLLNAALRCCLLGGCLSFGTPLLADESQECFVVPHAAIAIRANLPQQLWQPNEGALERIKSLHRVHEISPGKDYVFVLRMRRFDPSRLDSEWFAKLTINIGPALKLEQPLDLRSRRGFYLSGYESTIHHGFAAYADKFTGNIQFVKQSSVLRVKVDLQTTARSVREEAKREARVIATECDVRELNVADLTPWEGGKQ